MVDQVANVSKGRFNEFALRILANDPANSAFVIVALQNAEADAALLDYDDLAALLAGSSSECTFTNYARVVFTDADAITSLIDDTLNTRNVDVPDWTYTSAGNGTNNLIDRLAFCYDPDTTGGTDADLEIISTHDFAQQTNGGDIDAAVAALGFASAGQ